MTDKKTINDYPLLSWRRIAFPSPPGQELWADIRVKPLYVSYDAPSEFQSTGEEREEEWEEERELTPLFNVVVEYRFPANALMGLPLWIGGRLLSSYISDAQKTEERTVVIDGQRVTEQSWDAAYSVAVSAAYKTIAHIYTYFRKLAESPNDLMAVWEQYKDNPFAVHLTLDNLRQMAGQ